jgi:hypothetical protein
MSDPKADLDATYRAIGEHEFARKMIEATLATLYQRALEQQRAITAEATATEKPE